MACGAPRRHGVHLGCFGHAQGFARGFDMTALAALRTATGLHLARKVGVTTVAVNVRPQNHRTAVAVLRGAGIDACALRHGDGGGLVQRIGVGQHAALCVGAALPVTTHQHIATARGALGVDGGVVQKGNVITLQGGAATLACATTGGERAVAHDGQSALTRRGGRIG